MASMPMQQLAEEQDQQVRNDRAEVAALEAELSISVQQAGGWAPMQIQMRVDGWHVYVRERHDLWRIQASGADEASDISWLVANGEEIASGMQDELYAGAEDEGALARAVRNSVGIVRDVIRQRDCAHEQQLSRFCSWCGQRLRP